MKELALKACAAAANAIAWLEPGEWAGFILLILEVLDTDEVDLTPILQGIEEGISARLYEGIW